MIGQILFGLWVVVLTAGAIVVGQDFDLRSPTIGPDGNPIPEYRVFQTELIGVPLVAEHKIGGYYIGRFTVKTDKAVEERINMPAELLVYDAINRQLAKAPDILDKPYGWRELTKQVQALPDQINEAVGRKVVAQLLIEQLDFFDKEAVRMPPDKASR